MNKKTANNVNNTKKERGPVADTLHHAAIGLLGMMAAMKIFEVIIPVVRYLPAPVGNLVFFILAGIDLVIVLCLAIYATNFIPLMMLGSFVNRISSGNRRPGGGPFSDEAQRHFESHPYDSYYVDSSGHSWDNCM